MYAKLDINCSEKFYLYIDINKDKPNKPHYKRTIYSYNDGTVQFSTNLSFGWCMFDSILNIPNKRGNLLKMLISLRKPQILGFHH